MDLSLCKNSKYVLSYLAYSFIAHQAANCMHFAHKMHKYWMKVKALWNSQFFGTFRFASTTCRNKVGFIWYDDVMHSFCYSGNCSGNVYVDMNRGIESDLNDQIANSESKEQCIYKLHEHD